MIKRIISFILTMSVLLMVMPAWGVMAGSAEIMPMAVSSFSGGSGTSGSPYLISTAADLKQLATDVNGGESYSGKYFKMTANIDLKGSKSNKWTPIGIYGSGSFDVNKPFAGIFDGGGYKISNIYIYAGTSSDDALDSEGGGLFGNLSGTVKNLGVTSGTLRNESSYTWSYPCTGAIAGYSNGTIQNCYNAVNIIGTYAGGIVGRIGGGTVESCYNVGDITGNTSSYDELGGIVGVAKGGTISNCYNRGKVARSSSTAWYTLGGIVSNVSDSVTVKNCYNFGTITGSNVTYCSAGSIAGGTDRNGVVTNCYFDSSKFSTGVGRSNSDVSTVKGLTTANFSTQSNFSGFDFSSTWTMSDWSARPVLKNNSFTVTLYYNYPGNSDSEKHIVDYKTSFGTTNVPSRTGYTLSGWNTNADGSGTSYSGAKPSVSFTGNSTLYAQWTANTYNITYKDQGNKTFTGTHGSGYPAKHTYDTVTTLVDPSKTGYTFGGWYENSDCSGSPVKTIAATNTSAITLYAKWTANKYTITYKDQGGAALSGTTSSPKTHTYDTETTLIDATKTNHQFDGWFKDSDCTDGPVTSIGAKEITDDITLYAKWIKLSNTVTFDPNGGTLDGDTSKEYDPGAAYGTLPIPTRTGYTFGGWFKNSGFSGNAVQSADVVDDNHTLYARWDIITYAITYELDGGTNNDLNPAAYTVEQAVNLQNPTKTGYTFKGWFSDPAFSTSVSGISKGTIGEKTFYAQWEVNGYAVIYNKDGGTIANENSFKNYIYGNGLTLPTAEEVTKTGYTFLGWYEDNSFSGSPVTEISDTDTGDKTFYAKWRANEYTVTFEYNGADGGETAETERPVTYDSAYGTLPSPTKTGHTFGGWHTAASGGSAVTGSDTVQIADDHTLYAIWSADTYTVTYNKDGGTIANETDYERYTYGVGLTLPTPTRKGYDFIGWFEDDEFRGSAVAEITTTDTGDKTYYAKWELITYTITYELNGGEAEGNPDTYTVLSESITLNEPAREGHTFEGWSGTDITGTSMSVTIDEGSTGNRTYTAHWTAEVYNVTLNANGGDIENADDYTKYEYGIGLTLPTPTKKGYDFGGWFEDDGFSGSPVTTISVTDTGDKSYCAKWELITYTITYNLNGGEAEGNPDTYTVLSGSILLNEPVRTGYSFDGWSETGVTEILKSAVISAGSTGNREFTANWSANQYTVTFEYEDENGDIITESREVTYDESYGELPAPKRKGFTFGGWFTEKDGGGTEIEADTTVDAAEDHTLFAHWVECQHEDMIWHDDGDGEHHSGTCDNCGKFVTEEHNWNDGEITLEPTTETEGEKLHTCTDGCGATYPEVIPKHEHDFSGAWEGHDENGHWHICPVDKATDTPAGHNWNGGEVTKPATETEEGEMTYTCTDCGQTKIEKTEKLPPKGSDNTGGASGGNNTDHTGGNPGSSSGNASRPSAGTTSPSTGGSDSSSDNTSDPSTDVAADSSTGDNNDPSSDTADTSTGDDNDPTGETADPSTGDDSGPTGETTDPSTGDDSDPTGETTDPSAGDNTEPSGGNDAGNVNVDSASGENAPEVSISGDTSDKLKDEVIAEHITPEEKAVVESGDDLDVILIVEDAGDTVPAEDKQVTEAVLADTEYNIGMYLNVDLIKLINGQQVGKITKINSPINVIIEVPEELRSANREFVIVRVHNGAADILEDVDSDPDTITIVTDKFSTYSIAYQDIQGAGTSDSDNPYTGVTTSVVIILICAASVTVVTVKRKRTIE